jgi:hypothetical protein
MPARRLRAAARKYGFGSPTGRPPDSDADYCSSRANRRPVRDNRMTATGRAESGRPPIFLTGTPHKPTQPTHPHGEYAAKYCQDPKQPSVSARHSRARARSPAPGATEPHGFPQVRVRSGAQPARPITLQPSRCSRHVARRSDRNASWTGHRNFGQPKNSSRVPSPILDRRRWAVDLMVGRQRREHSDVDVLILADDFRCSRGPSPGSSSRTTRPVFSGHGPLRMR